MLDATPAPRVRLSLRSSLAVVLSLAGTLLLLEIARDAERAIAWVFSAMAIAALVYPVVMFLCRFVPRPIAVVTVAVVALGCIGFVGYRIVQDVATETGHLQEAAPKRAAELQRNSQFLREIRFETRVKRLVDEIPGRLRGGGATEVVKSTASRGVAFLAGLILTIFFVLYGPRLVDGALGQIRDDHRRARVQAVTHDASRRALVYARVKVLQMVVRGLLAFAIGWLAGVPGPAALAVWAALWALVPIAGVVIGSLPIVLFAGATSLSRALAVAGAFAIIGIADWYVNRLLQRRTVEVGSFVIVLAGFGGLELYGLSGALLFVLGAVLMVAIVSEIGPEEVAEVIAAPLAGTADEVEAAEEKSSGSSAE